MTDTISADRTAEDTPTAPRRSTPPPTVWSTLVMLWGRLRRMATALKLLFALAVATMVATFIPQEPVIPPTVARWRTGEEGPGVVIAQVFDVLSLFDIFGSWWFALLTVLLFTSLTACLIPRWRVFLRNVRRPPARGGNFQRLSHRVELPLPDGVSADEALQRAERLLRTYRTRRVEGAAGQPQLAVERGHWREFGSLVFHLSFYLLLIGALLGGAFSFNGFVNLVEGEGFADTSVAYDAQDPGRFWGLQDHPGHLTTVEDFEVAYLPDGFTPDEFVSRVTFTDPDGTTTDADVRVNHPAHHNGLTYYQRAFGFAPTLRLTSNLNDGLALYEEQLVLNESGPFWSGRGKVTLGTARETELPAQIALEVVFIPDAEITDDGSFRALSAEPNNPRAAVSLYLAEDLGLDQPVPLSSLEWSRDDVVDQVMIRPGERAELVGGLFTLEFVDLDMWSGLQVSHQPYRWLLLTAGSLTLLGLVPSLYAYRRRIWVQVDDRTVTVAGVAQQRVDAFDDEFDRIVGRLTGAISATSPTTPAAPQPASARLADQASAHADQQKDRDR